MRSHLSGIDHAVVVVNDLDAAAATYRRLGFTLTPRGHHTVGSQNHCMMLGGDYLELLMSPPTRTDASFYVAFAGGGEGMAGIALKTDDAAALQGELVADGIAAGEPFAFSRPVDLPGGARRDARFRVTQLPAEYTPGARVFACQHETPELVWLPEYRRHPNAAAAIAKIALATDDVDAAAALYARVFATAPSRVPGGVAIHTGGTPLVVVSRDALARQLPGVRLPARAGHVLAAVWLTSSDRDATAAALSRGGVDAMALPDGALAVHADAAHGVAIVFR